MPSERARIGNFELDRQTGELWKGGRTVALQEQPFRVLLLILKHGPELTTREEIRKTLWPDDTFVDFDHGINTAIKKIRQALGDSPDDPKYIQTVARRGYRCVAPVVWPVEAAAETEKPARAMEGPQTPTPLQLHPEVPERVARRTSFQLWNERLWRPRWTRVTAGAVLLFGAGTFMGLPLIGRVFNDRGVELQQHGHLEAAITSYKRAITLDSGYAAAHYNLADAYEEIPDYDQAEVEYQRAIDADFRSYPAYNNLSRLYIRQRKEYATALTLLDRALENNPREPSVQYSLHKNYGWADLELGNLSRAEQELRTAAGLDTERGAAHCLLAQVLEARGKAGDAQVEWESCVAYSADPDVEPEWRVEAQERLGKKAGR